MKKIAFLVFIAALVLQAHATVVNVSVSTDKYTYDISETPVVVYTIYNPTSEATTLEYVGSTHIIDGTLFYTEGEFVVQVIDTSVTIEAYGSYTWEQSKYTAEEIGLGLHSVEGVVAPGTIVGLYISDPVEFEIVPEPASMCLMAVGALVLHRKRR